MTILARDKRQLTYIYSSLSHLGKQVLGYVQGTRKKIAVIDIAKENIGDTIWVEIAEDLNLPFDKIFKMEQITEKNHKKFSTDDWLKVIKKNPAILQNPIAINGNKVMIISHQSEILKFFGVDSAGLEKGFSHEPPTTSSTTNDENFI
jgi:arsenate reductase